MKGAEFRFRVTNLASFTPYWIKMKLIFIISVLLLSLVSISIVRADDSSQYPDTPNSNAEINMGPICQFQEPDGGWHLKLCPVTPTPTATPTPKTCGPITWPCPNLNTTQGEQ